MTISRVAILAEQLRRSPPGGIGTYVRGLLLGLRQASHEGLEVSPWTSRLPVSVRTRLWDRGIGRVGGDVVHAPSLAFPRAKGRLAVVVHDLAWREEPESFPARGRRWHEQAFQRALRDADHFVVPSAVTGDGVVAAGAAAERVTVIEEGCDHLPAPDDAAAARLVAGDFLLTVGTREPRKNLARLIEAYRQARPRFPEPWPLVVVGPPGWGPQDMPDDVIVAGAVDAPVLAALYRRARAFAYVPLLEGFGLPPVEAMHAGAPVVASTRVPSSAGAALEVDPVDVDGIADALVLAASDDATRADLIRRGTARAAELTWRGAAEAHLALWRSLM